MVSLNSITMIVFHGYYRQTLSQLFPRTYLTDPPPFQNIFFKKEVNLVISLYKFRKIQIVSFDYH